MRVKSAREVGKGAGSGACNLCAKSSINQTRVICYSSNFALSSIVQAVEQIHKYLLFSTVQWGRFFCVGVAGLYIER